MNFGYKIIAVDFDGTLCEDKWPEIGEARESLIDYLKSRQTRGDKVILWTCRTGERLQEAVDWCYERRLIFDAINANLPEVIEACGGDSRKIYADEYIDDKMVNQFGYRSAFVLSIGMRAKCYMVDDATRMDMDEHGYLHLVESLPMHEMNIVHNGSVAEMDDYMKMRSFGEIDEMHEVDFKFDPA